VHSAVDMLGHLLAMHVTAAHRAGPGAGGELAWAVRRDWGSVGRAFVDQGYTGNVARAARGRGHRPIGGEAAGGEKGFVLLPRWWVVERSFAWAARFRRLACDYERLVSTLAGPLRRLRLPHAGAAGGDRRKPIRRSR
jgi:transposase